MSTVETSYWWDSLFILVTKYHSGDQSREVICTDNVQFIEYKRSTHKVLREKPKAKEKL